MVSLQLPELANTTWKTELEVDGLSEAGKPVPDFKGSQFETGPHWPACGPVSSRPSGDSQKKSLKMTKNWRIRHLKPMALRLLMAIVKLVDSRTLVSK